MAQREILFVHTHRDQQITLLRDTETGIVSMLLVPSALSDHAIVDKNCASDSIVHLHCRGDKLPWAFASARMEGDTLVISGLTEFDGFVAEMLV